MTSKWPKVDVKISPCPKLTTYSKLAIFHYEKLHLSKPHYLVIKTLKTTHIQLLCNYFLGIITSVELSPL